jgi:hypothetical protein
VVGPDAFRRECERLALVVRERFERGTCLGEGNLERGGRRGLPAIEARGELHEGIVAARADRFEDRGRRGLHRRILRRFEREQPFERGVEARIGRREAPNLHSPLRATIR